MQKLKKNETKQDKTKKQKQKQKQKLNSLTIKDNFFSGRIYFTSNDGSQNTFVYQPTLNTLELKKDKGTNYLLCWKSSKGVYVMRCAIKYQTLKNSV